MFITIEGIDGAGKSTLAKGVDFALRENGINSVFLNRREPRVDDDYVMRHLDALSRSLWPVTHEEPQFHLGDHYFVHLTAAWLTLLDRFVVRPQLARGFLVIVDGWYLKPLARFQLRPHISKDLTSALFEHLSKPDLVVMLTTDPTTASGRKRTLSNAEAGLNDGYDGLTRNNFVSYQRRVFAELVRLADCESGQLLRLSPATCDPVELLSKRIMAQLTAL